MSNEDRNITWQASSLSRQDRENNNGHHSRTLWFTGLSGSGKSSIAFALERYLHEQESAVMYWTEIMSDMD